MTSSKPPRAGDPASGGPGWGGTWPLFQEPSGEQLPDNPKLVVTPFRPDPAELADLGGREDLPETTAQAEHAERALRASAPPPAPEWLRAARAMVDWLEQRIRQGSLSPLEEATISRTWAAFSLAGASEPQVMRVAHLVTRAYQALRQTPRAQSELQAALSDGAGVLHRSLPTPVRERISLERVVHVMRRLKSEPDAWAAVVEGTSELLGWKDYARLHAALVLRTLIERNR